MENLTLVDPYLNTDAAVGGRSFSKTIVDIRTQGLQRNGALVVMLGACDFRAAQTAAAGNLDAPGTHAHCTAHGLLHCTAETDALLELSCNVLSNQGSVGVRVLDLDDGAANLLAVLLGQLFFELLDVLAAAADNHAGTCALDHDLDFVVLALDLDRRNACVVQTLLQILTDLVVFHEEVAEHIVLSEPTGIPILDNADTETVRIYFLAH